MEIDDVFDELHDAAAQLGIVAPGFGTSKGKAYEVWIMLELVAGLMGRGFDVHPLDCDDQVEPYFRVSGSPADVPGAGTPNAPCHFMLVRGGRAVELHLGLNHRGISGSRHELDLTFVPAGDAQALRKSGGGAWDGAPVVGLELKAYADTHKLPHDIPRALLGVAVDLDPTWPVTAWTFHTFGGGERRLSPSFRAGYALLTATELQASSEQYLTHHGVVARGHVIPAGNVAAISEVVDMIDTGLGFSHLHDHSPMARVAVRRTLWRLISRNAPPEAPADHFLPSSDDTRTSASTAIGRCVGATGRSATSPN